MTNRNIAIQDGLAPPAENDSLAGDDRNRRPPIATDELREVLEELGLPNNQGAYVELGMRFREMMMVYNCAIKEVRTKLEILNDELTIRYGKNTIESINSRIKSPTSIAGKLRRRDLPFTLEAIRENIDDVAGVRVICPFLDDIYDVADMLLRQDDVRLISRKDYIKSPKPNGYRSLHLLVEVPVFFSEHKQSLKVEIQLRTIAMDFWASLEHQLKYKKNVPDAPEVIAELLACSETIAEVDRHMQEIRQRIQAGEDSSQD